MSDWIQLLFFAVIGGVIGLAGGIYLLYGDKKGAGLLQKISIPISAGALLAASFLDLLPEALEEGGDAHIILTWALVGFLAFFVAERLLRWFHHHHSHEGSEDQANRSLIVIGDTLHNFIDGLAIGAAFLVDPATGMIVTLAVAVHELPQEIGDFGLLLSKGMKKSKVLFVNLFSALAAVFGAAAMYGLGGQFNISVDVMLALTAGFFIYIAGADIIPTIHQKNDAKTGHRDAVILIASVAVVGYLISVAHSLIEG